MSEDEKLLKDAKKWPWEDRLTHKNWKVRNDANIDLAAVCSSISDPKDHRIREFAPFFRKLVADANAPVQDKALDALIAFLRAADADIGRYAKETCDAVVAKCLTGRPKTVEKAQMIFLLWVELEAVDVFLDAMEKAIKNKVAKAVVPAIDVMFQALSEFGSKIVPPKRILKMLPELFDHQDQHVRASAKGLTLELCRWIGCDPVKSILFEKMRDTMKKELESELVNVSGIARPTRKIRSEQDKEPEEEEVATVVAGPGPSEETTSDAPAEIDEYELVDPVDILTPLEKSGFWSGVKATKWSERKDGVAELTKLASTKKIAPGDFTEITRTLKKLITDINLAVSVEAILAIGNLARGLRTHFSGSSRTLLPVLLEKLKEKKASLSEPLMQTLQAMHKAGCISLLDVAEDVKTAVKNKVPLVRSQTLTWVTFCIETSNKASVLKIHKDYVPILMESLNDGTPEVRDAAFSALAAIAKLVGMRPLERSLEKLDDVRKKKLSEMIGTESIPPVVGSVSVRTSAVAVSEASDNLSTKRSAASMLSGKRPIQPAPSSKKGASSKPAAGKRNDGGGQMKSVKPVELEDVEPSEMSLEEIESRVGSLVQAETITQLKSAAWKDRLEAIGSLKTQVEGIEELDKSVEILVRLLCAVPGWNEKNVQVQQQTIETISYIASTSTKFPKKCVVLCVHGIIERVADIKTRVQAMKCLSTFSEAVGPGFIFERLYKIMKEHKNPKVLSEGTQWMVSAVEDFGISHLKLKDLIDFCKDTGLLSSNAAARNATIKLIGAMHKFVGPEIKAFMADVKPALLSALDAEYEKNPYEGPSVAPKKMVKASSESLSVATGGSDGLPREDISGKITPALLKNFESPDWKLRLESIEAVNKILEEANKRIQPTGTGELLGALRGRLNDSNKKIVSEALATIGGVAASMGAAVEKASKGMLSDVLKCLGDNKKQMRECTLMTLDLWAGAVHLDKMVPYITAFSEVKISADGRKDLFEWLTRQFTKLTLFPEAVHLLKPAATAMGDKSADVRKSAEACISEILRVCPPELVGKNLRDIQGPALSLVVERLRPHGVLPDLPDTTQGISLGATKGTSRVGKLGSNSHAERMPKHGSKTVASRGAAVRGSKAESIMSVHDIAVQSQPLLNVRDSNKDDRERLIVRRLKFEEPRPEHFQDLEHGILKYFREDLGRRLLSPDFKKHQDGIEMLHRALPSITKEIIEVLDVLLRWFMLRFYESNPACLFKVLEFLPDLFETLRNEGYSLTESEAAIFLPCLMDKSGHNMEKLRLKIRELMRQIVNIYPASKYFQYAIEGVKSSKNNRSRIECCDLVGFLVDNHGAELSAQLKSLHSIAILTAERDSEIRKASLNALATSYKIFGDDIWRGLGTLSDAQRSMIDEKFKSKAREMDKRREGRPGDGRVSMVRRSVRDNGSDMAEQSGEVSRSLVSPGFARDSYAHLEPVMARPAVGIPGPTNWNEAVDIISYGSPDQVGLLPFENLKFPYPRQQSVEGMKFVCHELTQATNEPEGNLMDDIIHDTDRLVGCLANKVANTFDFSLTGASSRSCKYVLNTLMQTFQNKRLAHAVAEETLNNLITELLLWLLDERVPRMDDGGQLLKALNVLMLKILDNADRTSSFVVLINLLRPLDPMRWPSPATNESLSVRNQKFSDLVVKCLIKLTKVLRSTIYEVDLDRILESIHIYLQELGMEEIRRRAGADDKPLRMVKTVLHELVKLRGTAIKGHLSRVPIGDDDHNPPPIILAYIDLNLQTLAAARMLTPTGAVGQTLWGDSGANNPSPATHSADAQLKQELAAIFKKIADRQTCTIGLFELYRITQLYPKVDIFSQLQNASEAFRTYIREGLAQMEKNAAAGKTPSSVPLSTPPPSALNLPSPKLAPLSPVNTNSMNNDTRSHNMGGELTNFNLPPPLYGEDRNINASSRGLTSSDRAGVTTGTLDAIRERMKSIQLAATGGNSEPMNTPLMPMNGNLSSNNQIPCSSPDHPVSETPVPSSGVLPMDEKALSGLQARMERLKSGSFDHI